MKDGDEISVSGKMAPKYLKLSKKYEGSSKPWFTALLVRQCICTDGITPDMTSYQSTMIEYGITKLDDLRLTMPNAGGLVIAPSIEIADYMADILEFFEGERPSVVHNQIKNPEAKIAAFRNSDKKWLVSVAMVSGCRYKATARTGLSSKRQDRT